MEPELKTIWLIEEVPNLKVVKSVDDLINERMLRIAGDKMKTGTQKNKNTDPFKTWKMPPQPKDYLKGRDNDCF